jgi:hypothetical protein
MSALKPSVQSERLEIIQKAARHLLAIAPRLGDVGFRTMDIFPADLGDCKYGSSEYTWRSQIAWTWSKAGWLSQALAGRDLGKHLVYKLLPEGKEAIERIATDPIVASFYISSKRHYGSEGLPASHYRAPELLDVPPAEDDEAEEAEFIESLKKKTAQEASRRFMDEPGDEEDAARGVDAEQANDEGGGGVGGSEAFFAAYLEQSTKVLEVLSGEVRSLGGRLGKIEDEVRTQSEVMLDATARIEAGASKSDVAEAAAELIAAVSKAGGGGGKLDEAIVRAGLGFTNSLDRGLDDTVARINRKVDGLESSLVAAVSTKMSESVLAMETSVGTSVGAAGATVGASVDKAVETALERVLPGIIAIAIGGKMDAIRDKVSAGVERILEARMTTFEKAVEREITSTAEKMASVVGTQGLLVAALKTSIDDLECRLSQVDFDSEDVREVREALDGMKDSLDQVEHHVGKVFQKHIETWKDLSNTSQTLMEAAKFVSKEILALADDRASDKGIPHETIKQRSLEATDRFTAAQVGLGSISPIGVGIIRPLASLKDLKPLIVSGGTVAPAAKESASVVEESALVEASASLEESAPEKSASAASVMTEMMSSLRARGAERIDDYLMNVAPSMPEPPAPADEEATAPAEEAAALAEEAKVLAPEELAPTIVGMRAKHMPLEPVIEGDPELPRLNRRMRRAMGITKEEDERRR